MTGRWLVGRAALPIGTAGKTLRDDAQRPDLSKSKGWGLVEEYEVSGRVA